MRKRIFIYGFLVSFIAVLLSGTITFFAMRASIINETKLNAETIAGIIINDINSEADEYDYDARIKNLAENQKAIPYRITVIAPNGDVLGDSSTDIEAMDNHDMREEVIEAKANGVGSSRRYSATLGINMLYVAVLEETTGIIVRVALPLIELQRMSTRILSLSALSVIAGGLLSLIISLFVARGISWPINQMVEAVRDLSTGKRQNMVTLSTNTELDFLSAEFNRMADSLEKLLDELKERNQAFDEVLSSMEDGLMAVNADLDILYLNRVAKEVFALRDEKHYEGKKLTAIVYQSQLLKAVKNCIAQREPQVVKLKIGEKEALDYRLTVLPMHSARHPEGAIILITDITHMLELEQMRTDFVANVSHELRTPLTSIRGYTEALKDNGFEDIEHAKRFLEIIEIEADRLNGLINDLMELSKIENRAQDINIAEHDISELAQEVVTLLAINATKKNIAVNINIQKPIIVMANKHRLKQLLLNLIDNGIKYNKENGRLDIEISAQGKMLTIAVMDTGEGIAADDIPRLFERFYRVEKSRARELGGTGLGLSIVKHITELYQGSVTVESKKGKGSKFIATMPIAKI